MSMRDFESQFKKISNDIDYKKLFNLRNYSMIKFFRGLRSLYDVTTHGQGIYFTTDTLEIIHNNQSYSGLLAIDKSIVEAGEKILVASNTGELSTTIKLKYDEENRKIQLTGVQDAVVSELDATAFIKDGMLDKAEYDTATKELVLTWNTLSGKESMRVPLGTLVDIYTAGKGINITNKNVSVKVDTASEAFLTVGEAGVKLSGVQDAINTAKNEAIAIITPAIQDLTEGMNRIDSNAHVTETALNTLNKDKQSKEDNSLLTSDKTVIGAINEIKQIVDISIPLLQASL